MKSLGYVVGNPSEHLTNNAFLYLILINLCIVRAYLTSSVFRCFVRSNAACGLLVGKEKAAVEPEDRI